MNLGLGLFLQDNRAVTLGGDPAWLEAFRAPSNDLPTLGAADFANGDYWNGSAEVAAAAMIGSRAVEPLDVFDPASITASGLECFQSDTSTACPQGTFLTNFKTNNWTLFLEWTANAALPQGTEVGHPSSYALLTILNNSISGDEGLNFFLEKELFGSGLTAADYDVATGTTANGADRLGGTNKAALTFTADRLSFCLNGGTAVNAGVPLRNTNWAVYTIGKPDGGAGAGALNGRIKKIGLYAPQLDADLPAMTAL